MRSPAMSPPRKYPIPNQDSKSPEILPPRKDPILNQDSNRIIKEEDKIIPPLLEKYTIGYKPLFNDAHYQNKTEDEINDSTYNSCIEIDDYLNKLNVKTD